MSGGLSSEGVSKVLPPAKLGILDDPEKSLSTGEVGHASWDYRAACSSLITPPLKKNEVVR